MNIDYFIQKLVQQKINSLQLYILEIKFLVFLQSRNNYYVYV